MDFPCSSSNLLPLAVLCTLENIYALLLVIYVLGGFFSAWAFHAGVFFLMWLTHSDTKTKKNEGLAEGIRLIDIDVAWIIMKWEELIGHGTPQGHLLCYRGAESTEQHSLRKQSCSRTLQLSRILYPVQRLLLTPAAFLAESGIKNSLQEARKNTLKLQVQVLQWRHD